MRSDCFWIIIIGLLLQSGISSASPPRRGHHPIRQDPVNLTEPDRSCNSSNDYLEAILRPDRKNQNCEGCNQSQNVSPSFPVEKNLSDANSAANPFYKCILAGMKSDEHNRSIGTVDCANPNSPVHAPIPCVSENLVQATTKAFLDATSCVGVPAQEMFPMLFHESGFFMNARSPTGAGGVGQLTSGAISDVNRSVLKIYSNGRRGRRPEGLQKPCFDDLFDHPMPSRGNVPICEKIGLPDHMERNFLYSILFYNQTRKRAEKDIMKWINGDRDRDLPGWSGVSVKSWDNNDKKRDSDIEEMITELSYFMYNGGRGGVGVVFRELENAYPKGITPNPGRPLEELSIGEAFRNRLSVFLKDDYGLPRVPQKRREEVANYTQHIDDRVDALEKKTDLKCY